MTTITVSTTLGIDLNPASYTSPVVIGAGVTVSNPGYPYAVYRHSGATKFFVVDNNGAITSSSGIGVYLAPGGSVTNAATAFITAATGVRISGGAGTVVNDGSIAGNYGVVLSGGTLTNAGSIIGNSGTAVAFGGTGSDLLVLDAGFGFSGGVRLFADDLTCVGCGIG